MKFLLLTILSFGLLSVGNAETLKSLNNQKPPFKLPVLSYKLDSLSPAISQTTMELHHGKHHQAYIDKANSALADSKLTLLALMRSISKQSEVVRNNAGGHFNHAFFWTVLTPDKKAQQLPKRLETEIAKAFGSVDQFKDAFEKASTSVFGSGWAWLIRDASGSLKIVTTPNQDNPLMDIAKEQGHPILGLDVWEHAYYLSYQNRRGEYAKQFWSVVNWAQVDKYDREFKK